MIPKEEKEKMMALLEEIITADAHESAKKAAELRRIYSSLRTKLHKNQRGAGQREQAAVNA